MNYIGINTPSGVSGVNLEHVSYIEYNKEENLVRFITTSGTQLSFSCDTEWFNMIADKIGIGRVNE